MAQYFSPSEAAERLGVTVRALRVYERRGLVKPLRTAAGWRAYGPDQIARLHQIQALKRLGLPLARIGELLAGRLASLDAVLALQEQALKRAKADAERGLDLLARARARLASGEALSVDDLTTLTRETTVSEFMDREEAKRLFDPLIEKHFTPEERERVKARREAIGDLEAAEAEWAKLMAEARQVMAKGDPGSPEARDVARRWMAMEQKFTGGDREIAGKVAAVWREALADPERAPKLPLDSSVFAFMGEACRRLRENEASERG